MIRAIIITPYAASRHPAILDDYPHPAIDICNDVTGRDASTIIPPVNALVVEIFADEKTINEISGDARYPIISQETIEGPQNPAG